MKAVILAAGRGSRMGRLTEEHPKCLTRLAGRPLLDYQLDALRGAGISSIGVVVGYKAELLSGWRLRMFANERWAETNMVASLRCAAEWLRDGPVLVSYSDIFYPAKAVESLARARGDIAISFDPDWLDLWSQRFTDPLSDAETFRIAGDVVTDIGRRASNAAEIQGQYMGLLKFTPRGWRAVEAHLAGLPADRQDRLDMTSLLSGLIGGGQEVVGVPVSGPWGEVDSPEDLRLYERLIERGWLGQPGRDRPIPAP